MISGMQLERTCDRFGVALLRHEARTGRCRVDQWDIIVRGCGPGDQLLGVQETGLRQRGRRRRRGPVPRLGCRSHRARYATEPRKCEHFCSPLAIERQVRFRLTQRCPAGRKRAASFAKTSMKRFIETHERFAPRNQNESQQDPLGRLAVRRACDENVPASSSPHARAIRNDASKTA